MFSCHLDTLVPLHGRGQVAPEHVQVLLQGQLKHLYSQGAGVLSKLPLFLKVYYLLGAHNGLEWLNIII